MYSFLAAVLLPFVAVPALASEAPRDHRSQVRAAAAQVDLGAAAPFSVLAGQAVTNTGPTVVGGDLGVSPDPR